jgi:hypothetical protein
MEHGKMETYDEDPPVSDDSVHKSYCIKTKTCNDSNFANVSDHEFHCVKTEHADVNTPINTYETTMGCSNMSNLDIKHTLSCIKAEDGSATNIADMDEHG